jgi:hypothetical protein
MASSGRIPFFEFAAQAATFAMPRRRNEVQRQALSTNTVIRNLMSGRLQQRWEAQA